MSAEEVREQLRRAGERRIKAMTERVRAMEDIASLIPTARAAGISVAEIAQLAGVSREAIYTQMRADGVR